MEGMDGDVYKYPDVFFDVTNLTMCSVKFLW